MDLIIDFDNINDSSKQDWPLRTLKIMGIGYHTAEKPQTLDEYNKISKQVMQKSKKVISSPMIS